MSLEDSPTISTELYVDEPLETSGTASNSKHPSLWAKSPQTGSPSTVGLHVALLPHDHADAVNAPFHWDLTEHPDKVQGPKIFGPLVRSPYTLHPVVFEQPAFVPLQTEITITVANAPFPWKLTVEAPDDQPGIRIKDLFYGIHVGLRTRVTEAELQELYGHSPKLEAQIKRAFLSRLERIQDHAERSREKGRGIRRLDVLPALKFGGLSPGVEEDDFKMHVLPLM